MEVFGNIVYYIIAVSLVFPVDWLLKAVRKKYNDDILPSLKLGVSFV